jgi:hypothetical protein
MGYYINQEECNFTILKENFSPCLDAIKGLMSQTNKMPGGSWSGGVQTDRWFSWVNTERVLSAETLVDALYAWRWDASLDSNGNIEGIYFLGEKAGSDDDLMEVIAPFVKCGSYIQMRGEEGEIWRWFFKGGKMYQQEAKIVWD